MAELGLPPSPSGLPVPPSDAQSDPSRACSVHLELGRRFDRRESRERKVQEGNKKVSLTNESHIS
jgi:hypothetical protein